MLHRGQVFGLLGELGARPQPARELVMGSVGRLFGFLCRFAGWFFPMYVAGVLEAMNVGQYTAAAALARDAGLADAAVLLDHMVEEEQRHEAFFADQVRGHALLRPTAWVLRWHPAPAPDPA